MSPMPELIQDVSQAEFESAVLDRSLDVPVLLDCWAPWCGPCKSLTPVLEKLAQAYGGRFVLAKLNTDEAPDIAAALQLRSIPLVMLFIGGQPVGQFTGALPEGQVRAFLDKYLPPEAAQSQAEALREQAAASADPAEAEALLHEALAIEPGHAGATLDLAERLVARNELDDATTLLDGLPAAARDDRHAAIAARIAMARSRPEGDPQALAARIAANPKDFEARHQLAALLAHDGRWDEAFEQLLDIVLRDKAEAREKARVQLVEWFALCPDAEAVSRGRRKLGMYLN